MPFSTRDPPKPGCFNLKMYFWDLFGKTPPRGFGLMFTLGLKKSYKKWHKCAKCAFDLVLIMLDCSFSLCDEMKSSGKILDWEGTSTENQKVLNQVFFRQLCRHVTQADTAKLALTKFTNKKPALDFYSAWLSLPSVRQLSPRAPKHGLCVKRGSEHPSFLRKMLLTALVLKLTAFNFHNQITIFFHFLTRDSYVTMRYPVILCLMQINMKTWPWCATISCKNVFEMLVTCPGQNPTRKDLCAMCRKTLTHTAGRMWTT